MRPPKTSRSRTRSSQHQFDRAATATSAETKPWPTDCWRRPGGRRCHCSSGSYPITPASDILHELSKHKRFGVRTFQAEDEIAGIGAALGAAFGGHLGVTTTSGPGLALKSETIGLAVSLELPLVICDIQRGGPSTGLPTKTEQSDLLAGDVRTKWRGTGADHRATVAERLLRRRDRGSADCGDLPDASHLAVRRIPGKRIGALADTRPRRDAPIDPEFATEPNHIDADGPVDFWPYQRDASTLARAWAAPGTAGLEHRIGGLEKQDGSGNVSYDPANHDLMVRTRQAKVDRVAATIPPLEVDDPDGDADVLVVGWGSTYGPIGAAVRRCRDAGLHVAQAHFRHRQPAAGQHRGGAPGIPQGAAAGNEPRPARVAPTWTLPRRHSVLHAGSGHAVQSGRAGLCDPGGRVR